jgi:hypothetical protein
MLGPGSFGRKVGWQVPLSVALKLISRVKAVFVDTDRVPAVDSRVGDLVQNETEAELVYQVSRGATVAAR